MTYLQLQVQIQSKYIDCSVTGCKYWERAHYANKMLGSVTYCHLGFHFAEITKKQLVALSSQNKEKFRAKKRTP